MKFINNVCHLAQKLSKVKQTERLRYPNIGAEFGVSTFKLDQNYSLNLN